MPEELDPNEFTVQELKFFANSVNSHLRRLNFDRRLTPTDHAALVDHYDALWWKLAGMIKAHDGEPYPLDRWY